MPWLRALVAVLVLGLPALAEDWPQWLGPTRDGVSTEKVVAWKEAPKKAWSVPAGEGHSSPVVAGGRVFLHHKLKDKDDEELAAFDAKTGKELWRTAYARGAFKSLFGNGPRGTPAVDGERVYTFGITGYLTCFEAATGKQVWQVDTLKKFEAKNLFFGASCSPLVDGKGVLVNVGGKGASIVSFDKDKGDVLWKSLDDGASYSSPIAFGQGNDRQVVFLTQQGVVSLNPATGAQHWQFPLVDKLFESSTTPVRSGDILLASSITFGSAGLRLATKNGKPGYDEAWKNAELTCYFSTPVSVGKDHIYLVTGSNPLAFPKKTEATLRCIEAQTGKELWHKDKVGQYHASLLRTGNDKLVMLDDGGHLLLLEPNAKEYKETARAKVSGQTWAHPALANGRLYLRDEKELICIQLGE